MQCVLILTLCIVGIACRGSSDESEGEQQGSELASPETGNANGSSNGSTKIWVEQIYGWRYPLCEEEKEAER